MRAFISALVLCAACTGPTNGEVSVVEGDFDTFAADVQPILRSCASLDCHGDPGRPLRLHALYGLRLSTDLRGEPVTDQELAANIAAIAAIGVDRMLAKPLFVESGGMDHVGGDLWPELTSAEYECVAGWLDGVSNDAACAQALAATPY
jgi:hypothetical protein